MARKIAKARRAVILTAIPKEYKAVKEYLSNPIAETHAGGDVYHRGTFSADGITWEVGIGQTGEGNERAAATIIRAIDYFKPSIVLFVGVAGGIKDVKLYDVVAARKVYGYEAGKDEEEFKPRPEVGNASYSLEQRARAEAANDAWIKTILAPKPDQAPHVFIKPIAAGAKVVASTKSTTYKFLQKTYSDAVAVEMEGHGFLLGVDMNESVKGLVIRGISDRIDDKSEEEEHGSQEIAASCAAAFAFQILIGWGKAEEQKKKKLALLPETSKKKITSAQ